MDEIENLFRQEDNQFTVFVVERSFVEDRGNQYFKQLRDTFHYFDTDEKIKRFLKNSLESISQNVAPLEKLISLFSVGFTGLGIVEAISSLCKIFTVTEHQFAGPDIIDPIILQEGKISKRTISRVVTLHKDSILRPAIILLLKDNDFSRACTLLSECPNGVNLKLIYNNGHIEYKKVVNCGAKDIDSFIDSFSKQCFSTCSKTEHSLLLNQNWSQNSFIKEYGPLMFKIRSNLLCDEKNIIKNELYGLVDVLSKKRGSNENEERIIRTYECVARIFRVFSNDKGGVDMDKAIELANIVNNDILYGLIYKYAEFIPNLNYNERQEMYQKGYSIFRKNQMEDHAIYCKNNMLVEQFYTDRVVPEQFSEMLMEAISSVPGMIGLSHIYNNTGVAYLYCGQTENAIDCFDRGIAYSKGNDRIVQNLALETNKMVAESYSYSSIDENRIRFLMRRIMDGMGLNKLPFLAADYILNILAIAFNQNIDLGKELIEDYPMNEIFQKSFMASDINSQERLWQLQYMEKKYGDSFKILNNIVIPNGIGCPSGKRKNFIDSYGLSPFDFNTWI